MKRQRNDRKKLALEHGAVRELKVSHLGRADGGSIGPISDSDIGGPISFPPDVGPGSSLNC
jgi:hypothetical protein